MTPNHLSLLLDELNLISVTIYIAGPQFEAKAQIALRVYNDLKFNKTGRELLNLEGQACNDDIDQAEDLAKYNLCEQIIKALDKELNSEK